MPRQPDEHNEKRSCLIFIPINHLAFMCKAFSFAMASASLLLYYIPVLICKSLFVLRETTHDSPPLFATQSSYEQKILSLVKTCNKILQNNPFVPGIQWKEETKFFSSFLLLEKSLYLTQRHAHPNFPSLFSLLLPPFHLNHFLPVLNLRDVVLDLSPGGLSTLHICALKNHKLSK